MTILGGDIIHLVRSDPWTLTLEDTPPRGGCGRSYARFSPSPLTVQIHELHGTGVESASFDQLQIFSELLEEHHLVFTLRVHEIKITCADIIIHTSAPDG